MSRFKRPDFDPNKLRALETAGDQDAQSRLIFDWWCDEKDRKKYIESLKGRPTEIPARVPLQDDPAPSIERRVPQGFKKVWLISDPNHVHRALTEPQNFSNRPYALMGGGGFLLGQDPCKGAGEVDWHAEQRKLIKSTLDETKTANFAHLARRSIEQAELTSLALSEFDLASFAEQAALRYLGQLYGYAFHDHPLLEEASRATYRALQYVAIGQHFVSEPLTVPAGQQALGRLVARSSQLMEDYARLDRSPRLYRQRGAKWPDGVQPWGELGLQGVPLLKRLSQLQSTLSGRDRANVAATMLAGTVGNIQSAVCLLTRSLLAVPPQCNLDSDDLQTELEKRLRQMPPMTVLPRRTLVEVVLKRPLREDVVIRANTDCLLLLETPDSGLTTSDAATCPHAWGKVAPGVPPHPVATHACLGEPLSMPLIVALVRRTLQLPGLQASLDLVTGEALEIERLWGFGCTHYPLRFEREDVRRQKNLIVSMRIKPPISENAARLRRLVAAAVPRIDHTLTDFGHLHFAWFEFSDDETHLVLRTIYDGDFDSYITHFAQRAGDLFDKLFECLEGGSQTPVVEHPQEFVDAIRAFNRAPLAGYLYSAYPDASADQIRGGVKAFWQTGGYSGG